MHKPLPLLLFAVVIVAAIVVACRRRTPRCNCQHKNILKLARQAARWSTAARQDSNAMIAILHANYGVGYLSALDDIATQSEIENAIHIEYSVFRDEIVKTQDEATKRAIQTCPQYGPSMTVLTRLAGESS